MNRYLLIPGTLVLLAFSIAQSPAGDEDYEHEHGNGENSEVPVLQLNDGAKWNTDAPLRKAMETIRQTMAARLERVHDGNIGQDEFAVMADEVDAQINYMIRNCKLAPAADAELHKLVGMLAQGVSEMRQGENPRSGAINIVQALKLYGAYFDHPGWTPPTH